MAQTHAQMASRIGLRDHHKMNHQAHQDNSTGRQRHLQRKHRRRKQLLHKQHQSLHTKGKNQAHRSSALAAASHQSQGQNVQGWVGEAPMGRVKRGKCARRPRIQHSARISPSRK